MKKVILALIVTLALASCKYDVKKETVTTDSTAVAVDSVCVAPATDSTAVVKDTVK